MENRFKNYKWYQRYSKLIILCLFVIFFVSVSIFIIYKGVNIVKSKEIVYTNNSNIDYFVYLKDNDYFNTPYLNKDEKYIASLIDRINVKYNYTLNSSDFMTGDYSYKIVSDVIVKEQGKDDVLWRDTKDLTGSQGLNFQNQKTISINDSIDINYDYYNDVVNQFKKDYGLSIDAKLMVKLEVTTNLKYQKDKYVIKYDPYVEIPLSEKTIEINISKSLDDVNNKTVTYTKHPILNYFLIVVGILFLIIYLLLGVKVIMKIIKAIKNSNKYETLIRKIFSDYDQVIVDADRLPDLDKLDVLDLSSFDDLIDAQQEVHKPIIFCELVRGKVSAFVLVDGKNAYTYIVRLEDLKK